MPLHISFEKSILYVTNTQCDRKNIDRKTMKDDGIHLKCKYKNKIKNNLITYFLINWQERI